MTDHPIRNFESAAAVRHVGEGLLARTLPKDEWTHEAHLAACLWLLIERPELALERDLPGIIRGYNEAAGGVNDDTQGYHETLTQLYIRGTRAFLASHDSHDSHDGYAAPVSPDQLGGSYAFLDLKNRPVTAADFKGQWTLLFFGYARCKGSCPVATPKIVKAARMLRNQGVKARAVFVDIEAPPQQMISRANGAKVPVGGHGHGDMVRIAAMRGLAGTWGGDLTVLTGTRLQLSNAARALIPWPRSIRAALTILGVAIGQLPLQRA